MNFHSHVNMFKSFTSTFFSCILCLLNQLFFSNFEKFLLVVSFLVVPPLLLSLHNFLSFPLFFLPPLLPSLSLEKKLCKRVDIGRVFKVFLGYLGD